MRLPVNAPYNNLAVYETTAFGVPDPNASFGRHAGIDIGTPIGIPLYAMVAGTVTVSTNNIYHGNALDIEAGGKWYRTMHMKSFVKTSGTVTQGQLIGYSGNTGVLAVGGGNVAPHVHFDVRTQYNPTSFAAFINPLTLLKEDDVDRGRAIRLLRIAKHVGTPTETDIAKVVGKDENKWLDDVRASAWFQVQTRRLANYDTLVAENTKLKAQVLAGTTKESALHYFEVNST